MLEMGVLPDAAAASRPCSWFHLRDLSAYVIMQGPLMLEMGVLPDVAAASSATMIMFTSISASTVYIGFGAVK